LGLALVASAASKFAHVPKVVEQMGLAGIEGWRLTFVAFLEVSSAVLFLIPFTRSAGLLLVSAYMGGAIATHVEHGPFIQPAIFLTAIFLTLLWLGTWLRHPQIGWSWGINDARLTHLGNQASQQTAAG